MRLSRTFVLRSELNATALYAFINANWKAMAEQGKPIAVVVSESGSKRTTDQNSRLHALLSDIAASAWVSGKQYDMETWKEYFRRSYIGVEEIVMPDGSRTERGISTTTLDVAAFSAFMDAIESYAQDHLAVEFSL